MLRGLQVSYSGKPSPSIEELLWSESWWRKSRRIRQRSQQSSHEASSHLLHQSRACQLLQPTPQVLPRASFQAAAQFSNSTKQNHNQPYFPPLSACSTPAALDSSLPTPSNYSAGSLLPIRKGSKQHPLWPCVPRTNQPALVLELKLSQPVTEL